eukprot:g3252.t2
MCDWCSTDMGYLLFTGPPEQGNLIMVQSKTQALRVLSHLGELLSVHWTLSQIQEVTAGQRVILYTDVASVVNRLLITPSNQQPKDLRALRALSWIYVHYPIGIRLFPQYLLGQYNYFADLVSRGVQNVNCWALETIHEANDDSMFEEIQKVHQECHWGVAKLIYRLKERDIRYKRTVVQQVVHSCLKPKKIFSVYTTLLDNIIRGLGFGEIVARAEYERNKKEHSVVTLDDKIESLKEKLSSREATTQQYCTISNLFLLWLNNTQPTLFKNHGMLLITPDLCLKFMMHVEKGTIALNNQEPPISHVLDGVSEYQMTSTGAVGIGMSKTSKYLNALTQLYEYQCMILNLDNGIQEGIKKLREVVTIKQFEQNVRSKSTSRKNNDLSYQDANMYFSESPIKTLKHQSRHLLLEDSMIAYRNRAIICAQTLSVSRYDELTFWRFGDMAPFTYSIDLPSVCKQEINVLHILQQHREGQVSFRC